MPICVTLHISPKIRPGWFLDCAKQSLKPGFISHTSIHPSIVNITLLLKRLKIIGLPADIIRLISIWLNGRLCYVEIKNQNSYIFATLSGIVQSSILGPILYAIFVSPLFDIEKLTNFADDNFLLEWNRCRALLISTMEQKIQRITLWLEKSGLKVNSMKTELCLFHKNDTPPVTLK